jgi:hypothetical protein
MNRIATTFTAFGIVLGLVGCSDTSAPSVAQSASPSSRMVAGPGAWVTNPASNPNVPGATGLTIVPGDRSTIAGDAAATLIQKTGS